MARDAGSVDVEEDVLHSKLMDLLISYLKYEYVSYSCLA